MKILSYYKPYKQAKNDFKMILVFLSVMALIFFMPGLSCAENMKSDNLEFLSCTQPEYTTASPEKTSKKTKENRFDPIIIKAANRHGVDPAIIKAIIKAESRYNPRALSKRGAKGLMQLMPGTAKALGVKDIFNPAHNIDGGTKYFKELLTKFGGKIEYAIAAYNAGSAKVKKYGGIPPFKVTRRYVRKVIRYYEEYKKSIGSIYMNRI